MYVHIDISIDRQTDSGKQGRIKDLVGRKEEIKCNNITKRCKK